MTALLLRAIFFKQSRTYLEFALFVKKALNTKQCHLCYLVGENNELHPMNFINLND